MKLTQRAQKALQMMQTIPGNGKIKIEAAAIRDLAASDALNRAATMAAISILANLVDTSPLSFEHRRDIDLLLNAIMNVDASSAEEFGQAIHALTTIAVHYNK